MTKLEEAVALGNALARSIGHQTTCPMLSKCLCNCDTAILQPTALGEWYNFVRELPKDE